MSKKELLDIILSNKSMRYNLTHTLQQYPDIYQDFLTWTFPDNFTTSQKIYHYLYNDPKFNLGSCSVCGNRCLFKSFIKGYCEFCSPKCRRSAINPMESESSRKKLSQTKTKQYGDKCWHDSVVSKNRNTCKKLYGGIGFASPELKEKSLTTNLIINGNREYRNHTKIKETNLINLGVEYPFQSKNIQEKVNQTFLQKIGKTRSSDVFKKYYESVGIKNISQTHEWAVKVHKNINYDGISFDSNWEVIVYKFCKEHSLNCEYQPNIIFEYEFDNTTHYYHPDFLIEGKIFEVKGEQFFDGDKMICPYDRNEYRDSISEAKHQCMIKNNVIILRKNEIENIECLLSLI